MPTMEAMPERLRAVLAGHPGVRLAYVFGSAARGALRADSDVDVAVRFAARPTLDALAALAINLERAADAIKAAYPEVVHDEPLRFADFVRNTRRCKLYDFDAGTWLTYEDARTTLTS